MKKEALLFLILISYSYAATYYVAESGNDGNSGTSSGSPLRTIGEAQSRLNSGDTLLLRSGDSWFEQLTIPANSITVSSYGTGAKPVIDASQRITSWTVEGNMYFANVGFDVIQVFLDGKHMMLAHHPNDRYLTVSQDSTSASSFIDSDIGLTSTQLVGADIKFHMGEWTVEESRITAFDSSAKRITYETSGGTRPSSSPTPMKSGRRYYIANKKWMLDSPGEWHYENGRLYVRMPDSSHPSGYVIEAARHRYGIYANDKDGITIDGIEIRNAGHSGIYLSNSNDFTIIKNEIYNSGTQKYVDYYENTGNGIYVRKDQNLNIGLEAGEIRNNIVRDSEYIGIRNNRISNLRINGNDIQGSGFIGGDEYCFVRGGGISSHNYGQNVLIQNNKVKDSSSMGILLDGAEGIIVNNYIDNSCEYLSDCGGTYTGGSGKPRKVIGNVITNTGTQNRDVNGIYTDASANQIEVFDNVIINAHKCIFAHLAQDNIYRGNIGYDCKSGIWTTETANIQYPGYVRDNTYENNIFFLKRSDHYVVMHVNAFGPGVDFGDYNFNTYSTPDPQSFIRLKGLNVPEVIYSFPQWQTNKNQDINSRFITQCGSANPSDDSQIIYNPTQSSMQFSYTQYGQGKQWTDLDRNPVAWPVTLQPYTGKILLWDCGNACTSDWDCSSCTDWSECTGTQTRTCSCIDSNNCMADYEDYQERSCSTEPQLVAWYTMDSNAGGTVPDMAGTNDAIVYGNPAIVPGRVGNAMNFDGNDHLDTGLTQDLDYWTVAVWAKGDSLPDADMNNGPVMKQENFLISWDHQSSSFRESAGIKVGNTWFASSYGPLYAGTWYHLAATYDGENLNAYRDGQLITSNPGPSGPSASSIYSMKIGRHAQNDQFFTGDIDDVRVYNYAMTQSEIEQIISGTCVTLTELAQFLNDWKNNQGPTIIDVLQKIQEWKNGC